MKRLPILLFVVLMCLVVVAPVYAAGPGMPGSLPEGTLLPMYAFEDENIVVGVGDTCYGSSAWAGFTQGIVKNAPDFMAIGYTVVDPSGDVVLDVDLEDSASCWTGKLWDPASCDLMGALSPFNEHLGAKPYMMAWFTPTFVASEPGVYSVHTTLVQTRPAPDLMLIAWEEDGEMVVLNHHLVCMPVEMEIDWTFSAE